MSSPEYTAFEDSLLKAKDALRVAARRAFDLRLDAWARLMLLCLGILNQEIALKRHIEERTE